MPAVIAPVIKRQVIALYLQGSSRDRIAADNGIGTGTVSNIIEEWKKGAQDSDYDSVRDLAIHCKKEGVNLGDLMSALRIKNYIKQIDADEERVEQFIARCANSQDSQKLLDVLEKIGNIGLDMPLEELEEHIKQEQTEKEALQHEIDEARAVIDKVNVDRQTIEEYKELKSEMDKYHIENPKKILNVLRALTDDLEFPIIVNLAINPNTNLVYVSYPSSNPSTASVIDGTSNSVVKTFVLPHRAHRIAVNPSTNVLYALAGGRSNPSVSMISLTDPFHR